MQPESRPFPAYAHGAVPEVRDHNLLGYLAKLYEAYPISYKHRNLMRGLGCEFVYASPVEDNERNKAKWLVLLRFGDVLESRFGFNREIPVIYSPYSDLQIRTTDSLEIYLKSLPLERRSVSSSEVFVWAPDQRLREKLESWSRPTRALISLPSERELELPSVLQDFFNLLATRLASRDLYAVRTHVTGDQFFGRSAELQSLTDCVRTHEVVGVFGLRKTGKTSLLHELIRTHAMEFEQNQHHNVLVYQDLEYLPSVTDETVPTLIRDITDKLRQNLQDLDLRTNELGKLAPSATPSDFRRVLDSLLAKLNGCASIILILDEIEYLCPPDTGLETSGEGYQKVRELFGSLRKLVQERENFGFIVAGLASSSIESAQLYGSPNPLFSYARPLYLKPLSQSEAESMLNSVGKRVGIYWTAEAITLAHEVTGGHALLLRELASMVLNDQRHGRIDIVQIKRGNVQRIIPSWRKNVASHVREVLPHLRRYYNEDADLAVMLIDEPDSFAEFADAYPDSLFRLEKLGIIYPTDSVPKWKPSSLLEFSHSFERLPMTNRGSGAGVVLIDDLILADESEKLEKKETLRSHGGPVPDDKIVDQVLKACLGFLNRDGGTVLVGITDDHKVLGISRDIEMSGSYDKLVQFLTDKIVNKIGQMGIDKIQISCPLYESMKILRLDVSKASEAAWTLQPVDGKEGLYVRNNNTTRLLKNKEALDYIDRNWS